MGYTATKRELINLEAAIQKNEQRMDDIVDEFERARGICCPSCWSEEYATLLNKVERQELRYQQLYNRVTIHENPQGDDQLVNELISYYRERIRGLYFKAKSIRSQGYGHFEEAGTIDTKSYRLTARLQKILRRIAPTHPLGHLDIGYRFTAEVPRYYPPPLPELPKFGEDP